MKKIMTIISISILIIIIAIIRKEQNSNEIPTTTTQINQDNVIIPDNQTGEIKPISRANIAWEAHKVG